MQRFLKALRSDAEDTLSCEDCRDQLPAYLLAEEDGAAAAPAWAAVRAHLEICLACGPLLDDLLALGEPTIAELEAAAASSAPDFEFARGTSLLKVRLNALGEAVISFGQGIVAAVAAAFTAPRLALQRASGELEADLSEAQAGGRFKATVTVRPADEPALCTIAVEILPPGVAWPDLAGTRVTLRGGATAREPVETDAFGIASFDNLPLAELPELEIVVERHP